MANHMRAQLVGDALGEAVGTRGGNVTGVVLHSDRSIQTVTPTPWPHHNRVRPEGELQVRPPEAYVVLVSSWYISSMFSGG